MSNFNRVQVIGRLGRDVEIRYTQAGKAVASLAVAAGEKWKDQNGNVQEHTEWFNVSMFGRLAEVAGEFLQKGSLVFIEGKQRTEKYQDKDGNDRYSVKLMADQMKMLGGNSGQSSGQNSGYNQNQQSNNSYQQGNNSYQQNSQANQNSQQQGRQAQGNTPPMGEPDFPLDDDIPFSSFGLQYRGILNAC